MWMTICIRMRFIMIIKPKKKTSSFVQITGVSPYLEDQAFSAPVGCAGAKCFTPVCGPGQVAGVVPGECCRKCV